MITEPDARSAELGRWLRHHLKQVTDRTVDLIVVEIPFYRLLPNDQIRVDIRTIVETNLRLLARELIQPGPLHGSDIDEIRESAGRRAEEGVPLGSVISAYHLGGSLAWDTLAALTPGAAMIEFSTALGLVHQFVRQVVEIVAEAYLEQRQVLDREQQSGMRALFQALASGSNREAAARRSGLRVASRYAALSLRMAPHPDEADEARSARVAGQRKVRRVIQALETSSRTSVLSHLDAAGGSVLVAADDAPSDSRIAGWIAAAEAAAGADVLAGVAVDDADEVAAALELSETIVDLASGLGNSNGVFSLRDVAFEYQMSRPSKARRILESSLDPLDGQPDVLETLRRYMQLGKDRRETARELHVHPNTIDYRLRRVRELTGLNPAEPTDGQRLTAALISRRLNRQHSAP